jgi:predicted MFS family arabinose efflux permease
VQIPLRLQLAARPSVPSGLLAATAAAALVFTATPVVVPRLVDEFDVSLGWSGLISTAQLGGFVLTSGLARRVVSPSAGVLRGMLLVLAAANAVSALVPAFAPLVATRFVSGSALGVITWIAWSEAFGSSRRMGDVAVVGPVVGVVGSPVLGLVAQAGGSTAVFSLLAGAALLALALPYEPGHGVIAATTAPRHRPVPAAAAILAALFSFTLGGSATFIFVGAIGTERAGLGLAAVSIALALNALVGIPAARASGRRRYGGLWIASTGVAALTLGLAHDPWLYFAGVTFWGFAFWMGVPAAYHLLAERSRFPEERAGDAQAAMAAGRVIGPAVGGLLIGAGSVTALGVVSGTVMMLAGLSVVLVEARAPAVSPAG